MSGVSAGTAGRPDRSSQRRKETISSEADTYRRNGYLIARGLFGADDVARLVTEATALCRAHGGTLGRSQHLREAEDRNSADLSDEALLSQVLAIHFPHKLSPLFREALSHPPVIDILGRIVGPNVKCMQSMLFIKQSGKPGQAWHQDEYFIPTRDRSLTGVWIALDPATIENGCLHVIPGSHRDGVLYPTRDHNNPEYDGAPEAHGFAQATGDAVAAEVAPGDVIFFNGYLLHGSRKNRAPAGTYRRALVNHYMRAESLLPWDCGGQIPPTQDNRDIVLVRGHDPYEWKGLADNTRPYVRAETRL